MEIKTNKFQIHGDIRGKLISLEEFKNVPFDIKRIYYMFETTKGVVRGKHAHKSLNQILICVNGSCKILLDDGKDKEVIILDKPDEGLFISNNIWREMFDFTSDAVLMVLASDYYNEDDYIRDYDEFLKYIGER